MKKTEQKLNEYYFEYYGWIPGYNDFDMDDLTVHAASEKEAWKAFNESCKYVKSAGLVAINGNRIETKSEKA